MRSFELLTWTADIVDPAPGYRMLEVGCGWGLLTSLLAERLTTGVLIAIDRSRAMTEAAARLNRAAIDVGRVRIRTASLMDADFGHRLFDVVVAFDVRGFWTAPAPEWDVVRTVLAPEGRVIIAFPVADRRVGTLVETAVRDLAGARGLRLAAVHRGRMARVECTALELRLQ